MKSTCKLAAVFVAFAQLVPLSNTSAAGEADLRSRLQKRVYRNAQGESIPYRLFVPRNYDPQQKYPLILFLHGRGERGSDNQLQLKHAEVLRFISDQQQAKTPCFLVAPQCPEDSNWVRVYWGLKRLGQPPDQDASDSPSPPMQLTMQLLDELENQFSIDPDRRYVTGLSMGGYGTYDLCIRRPNDFAAAVPICGAADPSRAKGIAHIAFWVFHGSGDPVVPVELSRSMVKALKDAGGSPKYTEYDGVGHNAWSKAYNEPELADWLFSQHR